MIGRVYLTLSAFPFCLPGFHWGIRLTIRKASLSSSGFMLLNIIGLEILPLSSMMNCTITRLGEFALSCCKLFCIKSNKADMPQGYSGISSTTS